MTARMRLVGSNLRCVRGNREVFADSISQWQAARRWSSRARTEPANRRCCGCWPVWYGWRQGALLLEGGHAGLTVAEQAHYLGHLGPAEAIADGSAKTCSFGPAIWVARQRRQPGTTGVGPRRPRRACRPCRPPIFLPGSGGGCRWRVSSRFSARSGCSTSRPRRSTPPGRRCSRDLMRDHLATGGLIVAASHEPLGSRQTAAGATERSPVGPSAWHDGPPTGISYRAATRGFGSLPRGGR